MSEFENTTTSADAQETAAQAPAPAAEPERAPQDIRDGLAALAAGDNGKDLPRWTAADYAHSITGSGAEKLADSAVAPLIAAARGYKLLDESNYAAELKLMKFKPQSAQGKRMRRSLTANGADGMQMPWYSVADIQIAARNSETASPFTYQVRPSHPELNERDKPIKYEFAGGVPTPLDLHPATPVDWIDGTPVVMFAEGMLKGDSALSAYLHSRGVSWDDLAWDGNGDPREKLRSLMDAIPVADRVLVISIAGIHNDKQNPVDWREVVLKGRTGWIAFDADLTENLHVHRAAVSLYKYLEDKAKMGKVLVLNPTVSVGPGGDISKMGVDDYLAKVDTWDSLIRYLSPTFPPAPARDETEKPGNWRVTKDGNRVEECIPVNDGPNGEMSGFRWEERLDLGGRILAVEAVRQPTDQELRTGIFNEKVSRGDLDEARVEIEVTWKDAGADIAAVVNGPETILNYPPADWEKRGAEIPQDLLLHPSWPPLGANGAKWLSAIKAHRRDEIARKTRWMQMGWVPVKDSSPVFLIGDTVVGEADLGKDVTPGVDETVLDRSPHFGVGDNTDADWDDADYRAEVSRDFKRIIDLYIKSEAWTELSTSALILAGALRPCVPLRPKATLYIYGPKGGGKSWSAQTMMYFWARHKSDWQDSVPGSAKDTFAFLEKVVSLAPIWVVDDLAPSTSKRQAEAETAKLEDLTRSIFNNASKGRMNFDMTSRKSNKPISQLIITAENELVTPSVKERLIPAFIGKGKLNVSNEPTDAINNVAATEGLQARFTVHVLAYLRHKAETMDGGWPAMIDWLEAERKQLKTATKMIMEGKGIKSSSLERSATLSSDVSMAFVVFKDMAEELGLEDEYADLFINGEGLGAAVIDRVSAAYVDNQSAAPGASLLRALSSALKAGYCHVISATDGTRPPMDGEGESQINHSLGWNAAGNGDLKPNGPAIGTVVEYKNEMVILFDRLSAFSIAQQKYPELIPHGQTAAAAWSSMWDEGLTPEGAERRTKSGSTTLINTIKVRRGTGNPSGVPVPVENVLEGRKASEPDDEDPELGMAA